MDINNLLYFSERKQWRKWLANNFDKEKDIWLMFPKKKSGKKRIPYNDAVEEALCFGWIDSTVKSIDDESYAQRFTPRNQKSRFSQPNIERLRWLAEKNLLHPSIKIGIQDIIEKTFSFPSDIIEEIMKEKQAWINYQQYSDSYKRIRIAYIDDARTRPEEFSKRLHNFIQKTKQNKQIGFGGIEKYY